MKIVFCAPFPIDTLKPGVRLKNNNIKFHPSSWIRVLAQQLSNKEEVELHIITVNQNILGDQVIEKDKIIYHLLAVDVPIWVRSYLYLPYATYFWSTALLKIKRELKKISPDIVHGHGTESYFSLAAVNSKFPNVISIQGIMANVFRESPSLKSMMLKTIEAHTVKKVKYINVKTKVSEKFVYSLSRQARLFFIEAAINPLFWVHPLPRYAKNIFFVGNLIKRKGIEEFVKVYILLRKRYHDVQAYVIGDNTDNQDFIYKKMCQQEKVEDNIVFTGQLDHFSIAQLYSTGGIFCLTSYVENSPNVVMEAMASGLPVVATNVGAVKYLIEDGNSGFLVQKGDVLSMTQIITRIYESESLYFSLGYKAREIATSRWKADIVAEKHIEMYKYIIDRERTKNSTNS